MRVLQVSSSAGLGGAGIAAYRLHKGLRSLGTDSVMLVDKALDEDPFIVTPGKMFDKVMARAYPVLDRLPGRLLGSQQDRVSSAWCPNRLLSRVTELRSDILNLHWVNDGFMRVGTLAAFEQPVVWTFHDMWPMAGGEHYVGESTRYKEGYSRTNRPAGETGLDINRWIWNRKRQSWGKLDNNLVIVTPSRWLAGCVRESALFRNCRIEVLPNGVDHQRFRPMQRDVARDILGLPKDKRLILFAAGSATRYTRKGFHLLVEALGKLDNNAHRDYGLVVFGASSGETGNWAETHYLGSLHDDIAMAIVFASADVFVAPSLEDNLPNTVLEALSCGTPVVAFDIGGMPDMIAHKKNGYLAPAFDTAQLAKGITWVLEGRDRWQSISAAARDTITRSFTLQDFATRYHDLYQDISGA